MTSAPEELPMAEEPVRFPWEEPLPRMCPSCGSPFPEDEPTDDTCPDEFHQWRPR